MDCLASILLCSSEVVSPPTVLSLVCMKEINAINMLSMVHDVLQDSGWKLVNDLS